MGWKQNEPYQVGTYVCILAMYIPPNKCTYTLHISALELYQLMCVTENAFNARTLSIRVHHLHERKIELEEGNCKSARRNVGLL